MKIDLANIAGTPGAHGRFSISEGLSPTEGLSCVGPVTGEIRVENTGSLLLVKGRLQAVLKLICARCLAQGEQALEVEIEEEFASENTAPDVVTMDREEPEASAISDYVLDVQDFVRQQIAANLPMTFLCRPDCRGICPQCGQDLNKGTCECGRAAGDDRWAKLEELLDTNRATGDSRTDGLSPERQRR